jgi:hypothetical protein
MVNHINNYTIRIYEQGATNNSGFYSYIVNAKNRTQALYLALKRFYKKYPNIEIIRARVYSVIKNNHKKIKIDI